MRLGYMAINQYGDTLHLGNNPPRKALLEKLGASHAVKTYEDKIDGTPRHIGYIIYRQWFRVYEVHEWEK